MFKIILLNKFAHLPLEIINLILKYLNVISYRNGKYIDKITHDDIRYDMIRRIHRPIKISNNQYYIALRNLNNLNNMRISISVNYAIYDNHIIIYVNANKYYININQNYISCCNMGYVII